MIVYSLHIERVLVWMLMWNDKDDFRRNEKKNSVGELWVEDNFKVEQCLDSYEMRIVKDIRRGCIQVMCLGSLTHEHTETINENAFHFFLLGVTTPAECLTKCIDSIAPMITANTTSTNAMIYWRKCRARVLTHSYASSSIIMMMMMMINAHSPFGWRALFFNLSLHFSICFFCHCECYA